MVLKNINFGTSAKEPSTIDTVTKDLFGAKKSKLNNAKTGIFLGRTMNAKNYSLMGTKKKLKTPETIVCNTDRLYTKGMQSKELPRPKPMLRPMPWPRLGLRLKHLKSPEVVIENNWSFSGPKKRVRNNSQCYFEKKSVPSLINPWTSKALMLPIFWFLFFSVIYRSRLYQNPKLKLVPFPPPIHHVFFYIGVRGLNLLTMCGVTNILTLLLGSTHITKLLKYGHCLEGGGGWVLGLPKLFGVHWTFIEQIQ